VSSNEQVRLFEVALDIAGQQDSLVNVVIEVSADGTVEVRNWVGESLAGEG
jgi:hypothetical protein